MGKIIYTNDNDYLKSSLRSMRLDDKYETLRKEREKLFPAFNIYCAMKSQNCLPQTYATSNIEHQQILNWYYDILDLNENAIFNPPTQIKYFIK